MNTKIILEYLKKINIRLWIFLAVGLVLLIFLIIFDTIRKTQSGITTYLTLIFLLNASLSIYSISKNNFIPYLLSVVTIIVEIFGLILILNI